MDLTKILNATYELEGLVQLCSQRAHPQESLLRLIADKASYILGETRELMKDADRSSGPVPSFQEYVEETVEQTPPMEETPAQAEEEAAEAEAERSAEAAPEAPFVPESITTDIPFTDEEADAQAESVEMDDMPLYVGLNKVEMEQKEVSPRPDASASRYAALRKLFSVNNRFRFRKQLFHNSDSELTAALQFLAGLGSIQEAEDYVYNDLALEPESPDTADFLAILEKFYG